MHSETHELSSVSHYLCESGQFTVLSDQVNVAWRISWWPLKAIPMTLEKKELTLKLRMKHKCFSKKFMHIYQRSASILTFAGSKNFINQESWDSDCLSSIFRHFRFLRSIFWSYGNHFDIIFVRISTFTARSVSLRGKLLLWGHEECFDVMLMHFWHLQGVMEILWSLNVATSLATKG